MWKYRDTDDNIEPAKFYSTQAFEEDSKTRYVAKAALDGAFFY